MPSRIVSTSVGRVLVDFHLVGSAGDESPHTGVYVSPVHGDNGWPREDLAAHAPEGNLGAHERDLWSCLEAVGVPESEARALADDLLHEWHRRRPEQERQWRELVDENEQASARRREALFSLYWATLFSLAAVGGGFLVWLLIRTIL